MAHSAPTFEMSRDEGSGSDSGWVLAPLGYTGEQAEYRSLYEIAVAHPHVIPFLAVPSAVSVTRLHGAPEIEWNDQLLTSETHAFLQELLGTS